MIKKLSLLAVTTTSLFSYTAEAYAPWQRNYAPKKYVRLETGYMFNNRVEDDKDIYKTSKGIFGGAAFGYEYMNNYKGEIEFLYTPPLKMTYTKSSGKAELKVSHLALLANAYYMVKEFEYFTPYVFAGVGIARNRTSDIKDYDGSGGLVNVQNKSGNNHYVWNAGGGISWEFTPHSVIDLGYRFIDYGALKTDTRGVYGPSHPQAGTSHSDPAYNYKFGKVKSYQFTLSWRFFVN